MTDLNEIARKVAEELKAAYIGEVQWIRHDTEKSAQIILSALQQAVKEADTEKKLLEGRNDALKSERSSFLADLVRVQRQRDAARTQALEDVANVISERIQFLEAIEPKTPALKLAALQLDVIAARIRAMK